MKNKYGFTLTELIIWITISAVVLLAVLWFISNVMSDFWKSRKKTEFITTLYDFTTKVNEYRAIHSNIEIISQSWAFDTLMLYSTWSTGVLFGVVNVWSGTLDLPSNKTIYSKKFLWYKELTSNQVNDRLISSGSIYDYNFFKDKVFRDMYVTWFDLTSYNSGSLVNLDLDLLVYYKDNLLDSSIDDLVSDDIFEMVLTF